MDIKKMIKSLMDADIKQSAIAYKCGVSQGQISKYLSGKAEPLLSHAITISLMHGRLTKPKKKRPSA